MSTLTILGFAVWIRILIKKPAFRDYAIAMIAIYGAVVVFILLAVLRMRFPTEISLSSFHVWIQAVWVYIIVVMLGIGMMISREKPPKNGKDYIEEILHNAHVDDKDAE